MNKTRTTNLIGGAASGSGNFLTLNQYSTFLLLLAEYHFDFARRIFIPNFKIINLLVLTN